ncbi:hypothetical protein HanHA300_Chr06g0211931 [Helianthus annuus]|nr:hypothetical protein HanHA300_Chr06g0211931 [Helianthus annuus]KAJ0566845.1 hypothetical protein HanIR_Chr06g0278121 [Helianthus annuus]KAJ0573517.1 hypothetical protein HanHA89_Chr06g0227631 [Helianthus annuus]KAJ0737880.1 hypothetical protein HanLR1_Chr06g0211871 [Helianthus annuus]
MAYIIKNPPKNFKAFVVGHFCDRAVDILRATNAYREGLQVPGDVDNRESFKIWDDVDSSMIHPFVAFMCIRATGASNFTPIGPFGGFGSFLERSTGSASTLLGYATDEMGLRQAFQEQNEVIKAKIITDRDSLKYYQTVAPSILS